MPAAPLTAAPTQAAEPAAERLPQATDQSEARTDLTQSESVPVGRRLNILSSIFQQVRWLLPPYGEERQRVRDIENDLAEFRNQDDPRINTESTPPPQESIELQALWVAEAYPPSKVSDLIDGLRKLGWGSGNERFIGGHNLANWVLSSRASAFGGAWINLGLIAPTGSTAVSHPDRRAVLPDGVSHARGWAHTLTSSLTIVVMQFVFDDSTNQLINEPLRRIYETYTRPSGNLTTYVDPAQQKRDAVLAARQAIRATCSQWFRDNLPGVFSSELLGGKFPTCEFITTNLRVPFARSAPGSMYDYMFTLSLDSDWNAWRTPALPGLALRVPSTHDEDEHALLIAGRHDDIFAGDRGQNGYGGFTRSGFATRLHNSLSTDIALWALHTLLVGYQRRLSEVRDQAARAERRTNRTVSRLESIREQLLVTGGDGQRIGADAIILTETSRRYAIDTVDFEPLADTHRQLEPSLIESLRQQDLHRARRLCETEQHVRETVLASGGLLSTTTNLRLQRHITVLTWVLLLVALLTLLVPLYLDRDQPAPPSTVSSPSTRLPAPTNPRRSPTNPTAPRTTSKSSGP